MPSPSPEFTRFKEHLEGPIRSRQDVQSLDLAALSNIRPDEIPSAEGLIVARLTALVDDPRLIDALMTVNTDSAWKAIERASTKSPPLTRMRALRRRWSAHQSAAVLPALTDLARTYDQEIAAGEGAAGLMEMADPKADDVMLERLAATTDYAVRTLLIEALFRRYGFLSYDKIATGPVWTLRLGLTSRLPSVRAAAVRQLQALVARRRAGEDDDALGIVVQQPTFSADILALIGARQNPLVGLERAALERLTGGERDWAVDLVIRLLENDDPRAEQALVILGGVRAQLALEDWRAGRVDPA